MTKLTDTLEVKLGEYHQSIKGQPTVDGGGLHDIGLKLQAWIYDATPDVTVREHIRSQYGPLGMIGEMQEAMDGWQLVTSKANALGYRGKLTARISRWINLNYGYDLDGAQIAVIGKIARDNSNTIDCTFRFTDTFDWSSGDFGDGGSCFWGGRKDAKAMLKSHGGLAVLCEGPNDLAARAWIMPLAPDEHSFLLFNGYGKNGFGSPTQNIAKLIADKFGLKMKKIKLSNMGLSVATLWINDNRDKNNGDRLTPFHGHGYLLTANDASLNVEAHDLNIHDDHVWHCQDCNRPLTDRTDFDSDYGRDNIRLVQVADLDEELFDVCHTCLQDNYRRCKKCRNFGHPDEVSNYLSDIGGYVCDDCWQSYRECSRCHKKQYSFRNTPDGELCNDCYSELYAVCKYCRNYARRDTLDAIRLTVGERHLMICPICVKLAGTTIVKVDDTHYSVPQDGFAAWRQTWQNATDKLVRDVRYYWPDAQPERPSSTSFGTYRATIGFDTLNTEQMNREFRDALERALRDQMWQWSNVPPQVVHVDIGNVTATSALTNWGDIIDAADEATPTPPTTTEDEDDVPF